MTDYRIIEGAKKRTFNIRVALPDRIATLTLLINDDDTRIARNGDTRITRNGDIRVARNVTNAYPRIIKGAVKRNFRIPAKVQNG